MADIQKLPIIIVGMICATVIILFVIACIHDTIKTTANARSMRKFDNAFKYFVEQNAANNPSTIASQESEQIDFPNSSIEKRPKFFQDSNGDHFAKYR